MAPSYGVYLSDLPGSLPTTFLPEGTDLSTCPSKVQSFLESPTQDALTQDALWRDWIIYNARPRTISTAAEIVAFLINIDKSSLPTNIEISQGVEIKPLPMGSCAVVKFTFMSKKKGLPINCSGSVLLTLIDGSWKIWSLVTILEAFVGHENPDDPHLNISGGVANVSSDSADPLEFDVVIMGGGQNGLSAAGRLGALGIRYVLIEKEDEVGSTWSRRYRSLRQHTGRESNNLPFDRTWNAEDDWFLLGTRVAEGFRQWARKHNINVWANSQVETVNRNQNISTWNVKVNKDGEVRNLVARHLIFATGANLVHPMRPTFPGEADYKGKLLHSVDYRHSNDWKGLKGLVIGSGTQGHDVARDMVDAGLIEVHMTQRNPTPIFAIEPYKQVEARIYNREIPMDAIDRAGANAIKHHQDLVDGFIRQLATQPATKDLHDGLERAGFMVERDSGLMEKILSEGGKYYFDVGACQYIIDGKINIKSKAPISHFTATGLAFADGSQIDAEVIVFCTGYRNDYNEYVGTLVGQEIASQLEPWWGVGMDGEFQGHMHEGYPGLWLMGGGSAMGRWFSRFIALMIQLDLIKAQED